jgi:cytochrome c553
MIRVPRAHTLRIATCAVFAAAFVGCTGEKIEQHSASAEQLFQLCGTCHGEDGGGRADVNAPAIAGMPQWYIEAQLAKFRNGARGGHFDDLAGLQMRPMALSLTDKDVVTVAAYVSTLPKVVPAPMLKGGDATRGQALYATCAACHGAKAEGNQQLKAPSLAHTSDWYLLTQLRHFKEGVRGASPLDAEGATMRPMMQTLADEQAMKDVLAYVATLR